MTAGTGLGAYWDELVTVSLLGTDRRDPPPPPPGPIADLVADAQRATPSQRMLVQVAGCVAARRGGLEPAPPAPLLAPPPPDERPVTGPAVTELWRHVVRTWALLEVELLRLMGDEGWRPAPDLLVGLLQRHRRGTPSRAAVERAGGDHARWLCRHFPELDGGPGPETRSGRRAVPPAPRAVPQSGPAGPAPVAGGSLPVPDELRPLVTAPPEEVVVALHRGFTEAGWGAPHRAVLVNLVATMRTDGLGPVADHLDSLDPGLPAHGLAVALADCARTRLAIHVELGAEARARDRARPVVPPLPTAPP